MGSISDWPVMEHCAATLEELGVPAEVRILSAHRTPAETSEWASSARERGLKVLIAAAGGAAHLAGVVAAHTTLPVLGVPMESKLQGMDSLLSIVQMPAGIPVGTLAIGRAGAVNAGLLAASVVGLTEPTVRDRLDAWRRDQTDAVLAHPDPRVEPGS